MLSVLLGILGKLSSNSVGGWRLIFAGEIRGVFVSIVFVIAGTRGVGSFSRFWGIGNIVLETVVEAPEVEILGDAVGNGCGVAVESCAADVEIKLVLFRNFITGAGVVVVDVVVFGVVMALETT